MSDSLAPSAGPAPCSAHSAWSPTQARRTCAQRLDVVGMAKSSKLVAAKRGRVLLVKRKRDGLWMFPGGRKRARESDKDCLRREIKEELPKLKLGRLRLWKEIKAKNRRSPQRIGNAHLADKLAYLVRWVGHHGASTSSASTI